jgi:hypothetical protein
VLPHISNGLLNSPIMNSTHLTSYETGSIRIWIRLLIIYRVPAVMSEQFVGLSIPRANIWHERER